MSDFLKGAIHYDGIADGFVYCVITVGDKSRFVRVGCGDVCELFHGGGVFLRAVEVHGSIAAMQAYSISSAGPVFAVEVDDKTPFTVTR